MSSAVMLFGARVLLLVLLYLFLFVVVRALRRDLRAATRRTTASIGPAATNAPSAGAGAGTPVLGAQTTGAPTKRARPTEIEVVDAGQSALAPGQRFPLRDTLSIGRSADNDIALEDDWISARHLRLRRQNGAWIAEDLGSTNGTRVNGRPLNGTAPLLTGDVLDLGRVKLKVVDNV
ncbi:MAG: FHA domain-containing protein [Chloroflexi bacterium]|nr:FHA domain-containing protein [Chloroflexota bacterium]